MVENNCFSEKHGFSRRKFLGGCAACASAFSVSSVFAGIGSANLPVLIPPAFGAGQPKPKIRLVLAYPSPERPIWPNIGYDFKSHNSSFVNQLTKACPGIDFLVSDIMSQEEAQKLMSRDSQVDGYLVYFSGCLWGKVPDILASSPKPMVFVDHLYAGSGAFLTSYTRVKQNGAKAAVVSSSRIEDVIDSARCLETLIRLRGAKMLVVGKKVDPNIEKEFGTKQILIDFTRINKAYVGADRSKAKKIAGQWLGQAEKIIEPKQEEVEKSAVVYVAMHDLLREHNAQGITVNCLGGFYGGHLPAYPCLGFMQLNNDGFVGGCEGDQKSALTMLLMSYLTGNPGYISDPVIDTSKNQIIYAHCVAPTKVFGPKGSANQYHIRSHSEDRKGACARSLMPLGEMTTTLLVVSEEKKIIMHQGKTVENVDEDMACRNKLAVEVEGDIHKLLRDFGKWGWHRVTIYGEHRRAIYTIADMCGFEVIEEAV
ncbi:MAG: hypothetical protein ACYSWP_05035 [Planctomycetota bacterium]|jgi:L-fucose isomerase-like protein